MKRVASIDVSSNLQSAGQTLWDCIVIGAGPAGSLAARQLAKDGLRTLLVDRKSFPRDKVCGACVNHRALTALAAADLQDVVSSCGGIRLSHFDLRAGGKHVRLNLPGGLAVSRHKLDAVLLDAARDAGAFTLSQVNASVLPRENDAAHREIQLTLANSSSSTKTVVRGKTVLAADGLGHPSLRKLNEFTDSISAKSRIGLGGILRDNARHRSFEHLKPGVIYMATGAQGYVGMVRVENGHLNFAAAVDRSGYRSANAPQTLLSDIIETAGYGPLPIDGLRLTGTRELTRRINRVASDRVFVVGDAAGYVEPFTGEGMAWAFAGGLSVAPVIRQSLSDSVSARLAETRWQQHWDQQIASRQRWCRRLAWLLRRPRGIDVAMKTACAFPRLTSPIIQSMNASFAG
ncbi:NAD(P)/FAD-dependent oxidoreductase [Crateriforma conspicua]|uniref:Putative oxidoreductase n=1 Tax=Crateriforma conspicua TaxID=2527996 RepID=A0A5C6FP22_9PLAN|nr:NAD(P)/FAD-dependent oxidoreductase [Crateriforma conspicua]TWU63149.1 putative oxidoreductase [Crateriforma conspicua]